MLQAEQRVLMGERVDVVEGTWAMAIFMVADLSGWLAISSTNASAVPPFANPFDIGL